MTRRRRISLYLLFTYIKLDDSIKCISILEVLSRASNSGNVDVQLGEMYLQKHLWGMAVIKLERGVSRGGVDDLSYAYMLLSKGYAKLDKDKIFWSYYLKAPAFGVCAKSVYK